jgi:UDP:flavonoid glycosyltransferase YjiC (YdhE family)
LFLGFGSMPVTDAALLELARDAARRQGLRLVMSRGRTDLTTGDKDVCMVDDVDHAWLFPRCAAIVHHGGASTTGAALIAGKPQVVCAVFADQPMWGRRVHKLGVGEMLRFQRLSASRLHACLTRVRSDEVAQRAAQLGATLSAKPSGALLAAQHISEHGHTYPIPGT